MDVVILYLLHGYYFKETSTCVTHTAMADLGVCKKKMLVCLKTLGKHEQIIALNPSTPHLPLYSALHD